MSEAYKISHGSYYSHKLCICMCICLYVCMYADGHSSSGEARHTRDLSLSLDAVEALQFLIVGSCDGNM